MSNKRGNNNYKHQFTPEVKQKSFLDQSCDIIKLYY